MANIEKNQKLQNLLKILLTVIMVILPRSISLEPVGYFVFIMRKDKSVVSFCRDLTRSDLIFFLKTRGSSLGMPQNPIYLIKEYEVEKNCIKEGQELLDFKKLISNVNDPYS